MIHQMHKRHIFLQRILGLRHHQHNESTVLQTILISTKSLTENMIITSIN